MLRIAIFVACFLGAPLLAAEDRSPQGLAVARELFESASAARERDDWAGCERLVAEAIAIIETPGLRFHLAFCKERQGRWVAALVDYKRALELVRGGVEAEDTAELLGPAISRLEQETPRLTLKLGEVPPEVTLYLDGNERSPRLLGKPIPVDPGGVRINVSAPGYEPFEQHINLLTNERRTVSIALVLKTKKQTPPPEPEAPKVIPPSAEGGSAKAWVLVGEGVLTLGGLALGVFQSVEHSHLSEDRDLIRQKVGNSGCSVNAEFVEECSTLRRLADDVERAEVLELSGYIVAGAGLTSFVATWLLWDDTPSSTRAHRFDVTPTAGGAMGLWSGVF